MSGPWGRVPPVFRTQSRPERRTDGGGSGAHWAPYGLVLIAIGILSLITAYVFDRDTLVAEGRIAVGQAVGPFEITSPNTVIEVRLFGRPPENSWAFTELELQTEDEDGLASLGGELWHETGFDSDGAWREVESRWVHKMTIAEPGTYRFVLSGEAGWRGRSASGAPDPVSVAVSEAGGSALPHSVLGIASIFLALLGWQVANARKSVADILGLAVPVGIFVVVAWGFLL